MTVSGMCMYERVCACDVTQQEELSSQQVRVGLIEKKLENAAKDGDDKADKFQQKLEDAQALLKSKEK